MAVREVNQRVEELKASGKTVYSISRINTINNCLLEAKMTYIDKLEGFPSIYGVMGSKIHEILEGIYNNELNNSDLLPALHSELEEAELCGVDFPLDFKGRDTIRQNWVKSMHHFCTHHEKMAGEFITEEGFVMNLPDDEYLLGYIDLIEIVDKEKKIINIYDFKTSTNFNKADLLHHGRQLIAYAMAKEAEGYTVNKTAWIMLKYIEVEYSGFTRKTAKKKSIIKKVIARSKIGAELSPIVAQMLFEAGYSDLDSEIIIANFQESNEFENLPLEIRNQFNVKQYIRDYELTDELRRECIDYIMNEIERFKNAKDTSGWENKEITTKDNFFCMSLCNHRKHCPALAKFKLMQELQSTKDEDLF